MIAPTGDSLTYKFLAQPETIKRSGIEGGDPVIAIPPKMIGHISEF